MFAPRGRGFTSHTITTKTLIAIIVPLITVAAICTALIFPRALAATIVSDNFNDNSLDTTKWVANDVFSGFTNTNVSVAETSQRLEIGPLLQNVSGSSYNGIRTANSYDFSDAYAFVELVQAAASNTAADAMFTVGNDVNAYYRLYVEGGTLFGQRKIGATKTTLFSTTYDSVNHRFLRIRHVSATGNVTLDTAPGSGGVPGTWVQRYSETWNSSISTASIVFELKGGTWQVESNAPGKVIFDNFEVADNSTPTVTAISPNSGTTSGGTSVTITGTGFLTGATVTLGGTAATNVTVVSSTSITATTPAHAAGTVDVVVTNTDSQSGTLTNGFTYSAGETVILSDDFNDNSLDTTKWVANDVFSGFTNTNVSVAETSQRLEIGPLLQNVSGSSYNGIRTVNSFNFSGAYTYVELVQAAASNTAADAMFTVGNDVNAYYRMYVEGGTLFGQRKIGATKTTLFSTTYDSVNHRFLRIRHDSNTGNVTLDTAPGNSGAPGTWVQRYSETWNSSISTSAIRFELKGGTWQVEANAPGKVIFDNFHAAVPGSGSGNGISNINVVVTCNTSVLVNFHTSAASRAFIEYGPTTSYGSSTIDDPVRFYTEHAIQLTGLSANTTYHFRINANSNGITQSADQVVTTTSSGATCPALPVQVDSRMPDMTGAVEYFVKADCTGVSNCFTNFQTALNTAGTDNGKRFITVDAGLTLVNQWLMPANTDQNWIIIRSSAHASLPEGKRVSPSNASNMFKIQNNNVDPPIVFAAGSNHIRIIGAEITIDPAALANAPTGANQGGLINFESNVTNQASLPKFIGVDRSYVHGWPNKNTGRGAFVMGEDLFFIDNYFYDFHFSGFDGQAILGLDVKRWKILNNTLVGTSENFMWGGDGLRIDGYVIGELEYLRNHMYVPCSWKPDGGCGATYEGFDWPEKNLFECKTCAKVFAFGNFFGGTTDAQGGFWPDAQSKPINLKLEQNSGNVESVTVTNGGSGYTSAPTVNFSASPGCVHGVCVQATATVSGGQVTSVTVTNGGLGYCIAPTVSFSGGGGSGATATATVSPQTLERMEDIIFYKNVVKNVHAGPDIVGHTINGAANCGGVPDRVLFSHNLFEIDATTWDPERNADSGTWNATGWVIAGTEDVKILHNTTINANPAQSGACDFVFGDGMMILVGEAVTPKWSGFVFKDNINDYRGCGIIGSGLPVNANAALDGVYTGYTFTHNGIMRSAGTPSNFPLGNVFVTTWSGLFS